MYIEKCQSTPGYNCSFYSVKVPSVGKFRRGTSSQLLGISDHQIIFLDDKTRDLVQTYNLQEVKRVHHDISDPCTIIIQLKCGTRLQVNVERERFVVLLSTNLLYVHVCMCIYVCTVSLCAFVYACINCRYIQTLLQIYTYMYMYICMHVRQYVCTY